MCYTGQTLITEFVYAKFRNQGVTTSFDCVPPRLPPTQATALPAVIEHEIFIVLAYLGTQN